VEKCDFQRVSRFISETIQDMVSYDGRRIKTRISNGAILLGLITLTMISRTRRRISETVYA